MIIIQVMDSKNRKSFDSKEQIKTEGAVFGKYSDGITSKFWAFEVETADEAKMKMEKIHSLGLLSQWYFTDGKRIKSESQLTADENDIGRILYFYGKELRNN